MKLDTTIIITKMICYAILGASANLATSLAQWANSGEWPAKIQWCVIVIGAFTAASANLLSFLSGSFSAYREQLKTNGTKT